MLLSDGLRVALGGRFSLVWLLWGLAHRCKYSSTLRATSRTFRAPRCMLTTGICMFCARSSKGNSGTTGSREVGWLRRRLASRNDGRAGLPARVTLYLEGCGQRRMQVMLSGASGPAVQTGTSSGCRPPRSLGPTALAPCASRT